MVTLREVKLMCAQHDELRALAADYAEQLARPAPDLVALAGCRWKLIRLVTVHLAYEDKHLYAILAGTDAPAVAIVDRMATELGHLYASFQNHVREWTSAAIAIDWHGYRRETEALLDALCSRMDREEKDLYPLIAIAKAA
jgi:hypothetical protein